MNIFALFKNSDSAVLTFSCKISMGNTFVINNKDSVDGTTDSTKQQ